MIFKIFQKKNPQGQTKEKRKDWLKWRTTIYGRPHHIQLRPEENASRLRTMVSPNKRKIYHESQKNDELHCGHFLIIGIYYQMGQHTRSQAFLLFSRFMLENISEFRHMLYKYNKKIGFF